jgi:hypothetical protein
LQASGNIADIISAVYMRSAESDCDMRMICLHRCERAAEHSQDVLQWRNSVSCQLKGPLFLMQSGKVPVYVV